MDLDGIKIEYLYYLIDRAGLEIDGDQGYLDICTQLQETDFVPQVDKDENRVEDCLELRKDFEEFSHIQYAGDILETCLTDNCTMMELLLVMAEKMRFAMSDSSYDASTRKWFLELLANCGLDEYATNEDYKTREGFEYVEEIVSRVIFRLIGWDGEGGLFPLYLAQRDQRRLELIAQMNDYIEENYDI